MKIYRLVPQKVSSGSEDVLSIQQIDGLDYELTPDQITDAQQKNKDHHIVIDVDVDKLDKLYQLGHYPIILYVKYKKTSHVRSVSEKLH